MEALLPLHFIRIHTSFIININYIQKIEMNHVLIDNIKIQISENYRQHFLQFLNEKMI
jgi:DNA-binding LytR/AlgR family response regulator